MFEVFHIAFSGGDGGECIFFSVCLGLCYLPVPLEEKYCSVLTGNIVLFLPSSLAEGHEED